MPCGFLIEKTGGLPPKSFLRENGLIDIFPILANPSFATASRFCSVKIFSQSKVQNYHFSLFKALLGGVAVVRICMSDG